MKKVNSVRYFRIIVIFGRILYNYAQNGKI